MVNPKSSTVARVERGNSPMLFSRLQQVAMEMGEKEVQLLALAPRKSGFAWHPSAREPCHSSTRSAKARIADMKVFGDRISPGAACTPSRIPQPSSDAWAAAVGGPKTSVAGDSFIWAEE